MRSESIFFVFLVSVMIGLYLVTLGLWELREGMDRKKYIKLMFSGLVLVFVFPGMLFFFGLGLLRVMSQM